MKNVTKWLLAVFAVAPLAIGSAHAETAWQKAHPARTLDNARLANQNHRIKEEVRKGEITRDQAAAMHAQDHQIRQEERDMASQRPGGHLTGAEQKAITQQENAVSHEIGH